MLRDTRSRPAIDTRPLAAPFCATGLGEKICAIAGVSLPFYSRCAPPWRFSFRAWPRSGRCWATSSGVGAVHLAVAAFIAFGVVLLALFYQPPAAAPAASSTAATRLDRSAALAVIVAGLIWGLFNIAFAVIFSFGPSMLVERGWS